LSGARVTRLGRFANQAASAQICKGIEFMDRDEARDAASAHRYDDLRAALDVLDIATEAVVQFANAHLGLQWLGMWRHRV
jgi:hypothetical protein